MVLCNGSNACKQDQPLSPSAPPFRQSIDSPSRNMKHGTRKMVSRPSITSWLVGVNWLPPLLLSIALISIAKDFIAYGPGALISLLNERVQTRGIPTDNCEEFLSQTVQVTSKIPTTADIEIRTRGSQPFLSAFCFQRAKQSQRKQPSILQNPSPQLYGHFTYDER